MTNAQSWQKQAAALLSRGNARLSARQLRARFNLAKAKASVKTVGARPLRDDLDELIRLVDELLAAKNKNRLLTEVAALSELHNDLWDAQIKEDSKSGALDAWIAGVRAEHERRKNPPL